jgi:hypothetical protein
MLFGLGNLILALRMRTQIHKLAPRENNTDPSVDYQLGPSHFRPPRELVDLWKIAPLISVLVTCGLLAI